jgi:hypothetical protein
LGIVPSLDKPEAPETIQPAVDGPFRGNATLPGYNIGPKAVGIGLL